jgi:prepilin-type N-terminal cleavage/methylation domain-containing protein
LKKLQQGFTLIELSIVLVIIGLIVGGVLVGQDLIRAAYVRAQISQIEKFNTAVNTFYGKYQALPGDMNAQVATLYGFSARGPNFGEGDGSGLIEGSSIFQNTNANCGGCIGAGEPVAFWSDLTYANGMNINLVEGSFTLGEGDFPGPFLPSPSDSWGCSGCSIGSMFPLAKIGGGNYIYAYSMNSSNYYGLGRISEVIYWQAWGSVGLPVRQAYDIDRKLDDGFPQSGRVIAAYVNEAGGPQSTTLWSGASPGTAGSPSSSTCYDNGGGSGTMLYSTGYNGGNAANCAISFQFQAGD